METDSQKQTSNLNFEQLQAQAPQKTQGTQHSPSHLQGRPLTPEEEKLLSEKADYWNRVWNEATIQGIDKAEESAKQLIGLTGALQALYVGIYAFSDVRNQLSELSVSSSVKFILFLLYLLPLLIWLISLFYAANFFVAGRVRSGVNFDELSPSAWLEVKEAYQMLAEHKTKKLRNLQIALHGMIFSTAIVLILLGALVFLLPTPTPGPTQIIILTPTPVTTPTPAP
jgi:hypothetical protein